jgi:dihydrofolate synthase / folylpolyglutamate synthase
VTVSLQQALEALYGLERRRDKLGLDGTRALLAALGDPHTRFHAVHVAGTNGKGSVCALVERVLRAAGLRTGLFTSPHLVDFRERIRVDGRWADEAWLSEALARIEALPEGRGRTFFEVATALGFGYFAARGVEWAVVEVGLGGRLDTTNVLTPDLSVITRIGLDHTEVLGDTLAAVAAEKAGIVKPGVPVVESVDVPEARAVVHTAARANGAPLVEARERMLKRPARPGDPCLVATRAWGELRLAAPGVGPLSELNLAAAVAALDTLAGRGVRIPRAAVEEGCAAARWPGRLERCAGEPRLWWDGAHNLDGLEALARVWESAGLPAPAAVVFATSRDKPAGLMLDLLHALAPGARLFVTRTRSERALDPVELAALARGAGWEPVRCADVAGACRAALDALPPGGLALLTGSLFAVGEGMESFGGAPGEVL